jgi:adenylate cyclase
VPVQPVERKLSAIFAADIAGYSRLMARDEIGTLTRLKACRVIVDGLIASHRGRIFNTAGDSVIADFASAVDAVQCAVAVQAALVTENAKQPADESMQFRIGVHVGDVLVDGENLLGDGVNIAARLETLAEPGAVCVSAAARDHIGNKLPLAFDDLGDYQVKNIPQAIRVYRVQAGAPAAPAAALPLPDKPSIAVLPFANMSGDPEQEYFADGMVEDIITGLSRYPSLFVIARNSCSTFKGRAVVMKQVGRELGVRFVLEGGLRKSAKRIRVTVQLVEAETGSHVWAERYDRDLADVFAVQDEITEAVTIAIVRPCWYAVASHRSGRPIPGCRGTAVHQLRLPQRHGDARADGVGGDAALRLGAVRQSPKASRRRRLETHRHPVHAIAQACWLGAVVEDMAEMSAAAAATDRGADHEETGVLALDDGTVERRPEARPAGMAVELGRRGK